MIQTSNLVLKKTAEDGKESIRIVRSLSNNDLDIIKSLVDQVTTLQKKIDSLSGCKLPIGAIFSWPVATNPNPAGLTVSQYLLCNGQTITSDIYPELVSILGGSDTAIVPNLQGVFLRGYGSQACTQANGTATGTTTTTHTSGELGVVQGDAMRQLYGTLPVGGTSGVGNTVNAALTGTFSYSKQKQTAGFASAPSKSACQAFFNSSLTTPTDVEIRPVNVAVNFYIVAS